MRLIKNNAINAFKKKAKVYICILGLASLAACELNQVENNVNEEKILLPEENQDLSALDRQRLKDIRELGEVVSELALKKPEAFNEVFAAINSRYYLDEMIFVTDLLTSSDIYNYTPFKKNNKYSQSFREYFNSTSKKIDVNSINTDITFYIPYSENHNFENPSNITLVIAQSDTDEAYGTRYGKGEPVKVWVDEEYLENNLTIIVGINELRKNADTYKQEIYTEAKPTDANPYPSRVNRIESVTQTSNSKAILHRNYDNAISFTGNGGGSNIRIARISGYLEPKNGHIHGFDGDKKSKLVTRSDVKYKRTVDVTSVWDYNWADDDFEQIYAVYEEDTENTKTFNGELNTTLTSSTTVGGGEDDGGVGGGTSNTVTGTIGYSVTITSKDPIIREVKLKKSDYMTKNVPTPAFQLSIDNRDCITDRLFLPIIVIASWPAYDCGANWSYTLPYKEY